VSQKSLIFDNNFGNCGPIFKTDSVTDFLWPPNSPVKAQCNSELLKTQGRSQDAEGRHNASIAALAAET